MSKTVVLDTLTLQGGNVWVDLAAGDVRLEVHYTVASSVEGVSLQRSREASEFLTPADRTSILDIAARLQQALAAQELS